MKEIKELQRQQSKGGTVVFIGVRPARMKAVIPVESVMAVENKGLHGDRYNNEGGVRQVTLIQHEHLQAVSSFLGREVKPETVRRNIVVEGINLLSLKGQQFQIGDAILEYSGECHPCSRMEENLGPGGYNAMRGHGGITAKVISGGEISIGSSINPK